MSKRWMSSFDNQRRNKTKVDHLWTTEFAPQSAEDLAVHKAKLSSLEKLLNQRLRSQGEPFLLLTGPSGCGKATAVNLLAKSLSASVQEWVNPISSADQRRLDEETFGHDKAAYESQVVQFSDFLFRANRYKSLNLSLTDDSNKRIYLVKDFPNVFLREPSKFHDIIKKYSKLPKTFPCIFVVTDNDDLQNLKKVLFPSELIDEAKIEVLKFNPIAQTAMVRALQNIANLASRRTASSFLVPPKEALEEIALMSNGDIRAAVNSMQFVCRKTSKKSRLFDGFSDANGNSKNKKSKKDRRPKTNGELSVYNKDAATSLFATFGKILHSKRLSDCSPAEDTLPAHLGRHRTNLLSFDPDVVFERSCLSADTFCAFLHQNYVDFCCDMECLDEASELVSIADAMSSDWSAKSSLANCRASIVARGIAFFVGMSRAGSALPGWMPLHKPASIGMTSGVCRTRESMKKSFYSLSSNSTVLAAEVFPFWAKMGRDRQDAAQSDLIRKVGIFGGGRRCVSLERFEEGSRVDLCEFDPPSALDLDDFRLCSAVEADEGRLVGSDVVGDEDFFIEDADD